ncbi:MAG: hypothetical protein M3198_17580, partial [Actinomycetota bacterium]|nr:hypothetical protein [Actinomycetota bacterium]
MRRFTLVEVVVSERRTPIIGGKKPMTDSRATAQQKIQELIDEALAPTRAKTAKLKNQIEQARRKMEEDRVARWEEECTALTT